MAQTLTTGPIPTLIRKIAVPASVGFFFNTLFNAWDRLQHSQPSPAPT